MTRHVTRHGSAINHSHRRDANVNMTRAAPRSVMWSERFWLRLSLVYTQNTTVLLDIHLNGNDTPREFISYFAIPLPNPWYVIRTQFEENVSNHIVSTVAADDLAAFTSEMTTFASHPGQFFNTLRPKQGDQHSPNDIFKCLFLNENV